MPRLSTIEYFDRLRTEFAKHALKTRPDEEPAAGIHFADDDIRIDVKTGYDKDFGTFVTDYLVYHRDPSLTEHLHIVIDRTGRELLHEYHPD